MSKPKEQHDGTSTCLGGVTDYTCRTKARDLPWIIAFLLAELETIVDDWKWNVLQQEKSICRMLFRVFFLPLSSLQKLLLSQKIFFFSPWNRTRRNENIQNDQGQNANIFIVSFHSSTTYNDLVYLNHAWARQTQYIFQVIYDNLHRIEDVLPYGTNKNPLSAGRERPCQNPTMFPSTCFI